MTPVRLTVEFHTTTSQYILAKTMKKAIWMVVINCFDALWIYGGDLLAACPELMSNSHLYF